jgi:hypothetical protein
MRDNRLVESNSPKSEWAKDLPAGPPLKDDLARLVDEDGARDEAECSYLEAASDPQFAQNETDRRRFRSQLRRRLRHRSAKRRGRQDG